MPKFIKSLEDLVGLESEHYKLEIDVDGGNGWIVPKDETELTDEETFENSYYLSTHTFYGSRYKHSTKVLQEFGFDVELDNWDKGCLTVVNKKKRKYFRKCGVCREKNEKSEMIRTDKSPNGWVCQECYRKEHFEYEIEE